MARVYRWACTEKRRTLEDLLRLADRLRADIGRLGGASGAVTHGDGLSPDERRERLVSSIAGLEAAVERAREELAIAEAELARVEQMREGKETVADKTSTQRRTERAAGLSRRR